METEFQLGLKQIRPFESMRILMKQKCYLKFEKELLFKQSEGRSSSDMPLFSTREVTEVQIGSSNVIATDTHQTVNLFPIELLLAKQLLSTFMRCFF